MLRPCYVGVNESYISSRTVGDGNGDGGTHWRIESNGSEGCVINNRTDGKSSTALNMSAFRVTQNDVKFTITKVLSTDNSVKISGVSSIGRQSTDYSEKEYRLLFLAIFGKVTKYQINS